MDTDDVDAPRKSLQKPDLYMMSMAQLGDYIAAMEAEIARARDIIASKQEAHGAADAVFKV